MKMAKKLLLLLLMAAPYFVAVQSRAGDKDKDKDKDKPKKNSPTAPTGNGVPLDGGVVFLMAAGLGLGAKLLYDAKAKKKAAGGL